MGCDGPLGGTRFARAQRHQGSAGRGAGERRHRGRRWQRRVDPRQVALDARPIGTTGRGPGSHQCSETAASCHLQDIAVAQAAEQSGCRVANAAPGCPAGVRDD